MLKIRASVFVSLAGMTLVAVFGCAVRGSQGPTADDQIPTVTYCELMKNPKRYHDKVVRVRALFTRRFEVSALHDEEDCTKGKPDNASLSSTWVGYDKSFLMEGDSDEAKNNQEISGFGRWWIQAVGRFRRAEGDQRFGHLMCCKYSFTLMKIEKSEKLQ